MSQKELWSLGAKIIRELEMGKGILASGREEVYGCIFGRDSLITALKLLKTYEKTGDAYFLSLIKKILENLAVLQGATFNIDSGEEPGKIIHEYRESSHEHLTGRAIDPWHVYPDKTMKNYDSVDSTALFLVTVAKYIAQAGDQDFLKAMRPSVESALAWLSASIRADERGFVSYRFHPDRKSGGLRTQSWMDSADSIFHEDGSPTPYPIAAIEVQAYAYQALRLWHLDSEADRLKETFNRHFVLRRTGGDLMIPFALDGNGKPMESLRSSIGHMLWASVETDSIVEAVHVPQVVRLLLSPDLFEPQAGIRTLSRVSRYFDPSSYHNGSIWPHDTAIIAEGLSNFGYAAEAMRVRQALARSWSHFGTPVELFVFKEGAFSDYLSLNGQRACSKQAWSAASILAEMHG